MSARSSDFIAYAPTFPSFPFLYSQYVNLRFTHAIFTTIALSGLISSGTIMMNFFLYKTGPCCQCFHA